jgi:uncharacterized membrane protein SpoIIM required for sporulation
VDLNAFVEARRPSWRRLEVLVSKLESRGLRGFGDDQGNRGAPSPPRILPRSFASFLAGTSYALIPQPLRLLLLPFYLILHLLPAAAPAPPGAVNAAHELAQLYKQACADLIRARSETANSELIGYLNGLVGRAYGVIYRGRRFRFISIVRFFLVDFPRLFRARWGAVAISAACLLGGAIFGWVAEKNDPFAKHYLLPPSFAEVEDQIVRNASPAAAGGTSMPLSQNTAFSLFVMTNNIQVSFGAFALGGTAGIGTGALLFYNGVMIGELGAIFDRHGLSLPFWALIVPHGVIELTAIVIAGAAGFLIARALLAPGDEGRRAALAFYGREAVQLVAGCAGLLVVAGLIEGFVTPQKWIGPEIKFAIGAVTGVGTFVLLLGNEEILERIGLLERLGAKRSSRGL